MSNFKQIINEAADHVPETILQQLGGQKFIRFTGAKHFVKLPNDVGLGFRIPKGKDGIRWIEIRLNSLDLYDITFKTLSGNVVKELNNYYNDMLVKAFEDATAVYTSL
jgi:hypothetical protein